MPGSRSYTAQWLVSIDMDEPPGKDKTERMQDENGLMLMMHAFLADHRVANELRETLKGWAGDREIERVLIMPLEASHPDNHT